MRLNYIKLITLSVLCVLFSATAYADWGIFQTYAIIDFGDGNDFRAGGNNADGAPSYDDYYYGFFRSTDTFVLNGGQLKTYKNGSSNVCGGTIYYRIFKSCESPGAFSSIAIPYNSELGGGDQLWEEAAAGINILSGLSKGDYTLEVYFEAEGNQTDPAGCGEFGFDSDFGNNWQAYFTVGEEGFSDGDHSADPAWTGDTGSFSVLDPTSLSGDGSNANINGANHQNNDVLVSNSGETDAALAVASTQAYGVWEFSVATGLNWNTSAVNNFQIVLMSNTGTPANLIVDSGTSAPNYNGYAIKLKNVAGDLDKFVLVKQTGTTEEEILDLNYPNAANAYDGYTFKVIRSTDGEFEVYIDQGFDNTEASTLRGTIRDVDHTTSSHFAVVLNANSGGAARRMYFDNLLLGAATEIEFDVASVDVQEIDADFTHNLTVQLTNADDRCPTTADVVLISGDATRIGNYTTQSILFPPGSSTSVTVPITISGNAACERNENLVFELQNVSGGCNALANGNETTMMALDDDESGTESEESDDFEDGDAVGWSNLTNWQVTSSTATISDTYDLKHENGGLAANDYVSIDLCNMELRGVETTWQFNMKHGGFNTSSNNWLMFVLSSNQEQIWDGGAASSTLDGYAVGVNFNTATDNLRLVRIDDGAYTDIISSSYIWSNNSVVLGIEVVRDGDGLWEFKYQENGGFDAMTSAGTVTDNNYVVANYAAFAVEVTSGNADKCRIDDLDITQYGCFENWYTTGTGNATDAVWSQNPLDVVGSNLEFGRFKNLFVQGGHTLTADAAVLAHDFTVENTGTYDANGQMTIVNRDFVNNGTFTANSGTVRFDMYSTGTIGGGSISEFANIEMEGRGLLLMDNDVDLRGVFYPNKGDFDTGGLIFRMISDASGTASIDQFRSGTSWTGDVNLERYIPSGDQIWFNLGNPLTGVTFDDWNDDVTTTGFPGADWPFWGLNNIVSYNETTSGALDEGFEGNSNVTNTIDHENGYMIYLESASQQIEVTGGIQIGDMPQVLDFTSNATMLDDGWNLIVNRYPSEIDWDVLYANSTGIGSTYYVQDGDAFAGTRNYIFYDASSGTGTASRYIPSSQSFWVKVDASGGTINWSESVKSSTGALFERGLMARPEIGIKLTGDGSADHTFVVFDDALTANYDMERDAFHLGPEGEDEFEEGESVGIATKSADDYSLSINKLGWEDATMSIPLKIVIPEAQDIALSTYSFSEIPESVCATIEDTETGMVYILDEEFELTLTFNEAYVGNRFILHFSAPLSVEFEDMSCTGVEDGSATVSVVGEGTYTFNWYDEMNNLIFTEEAAGSSSVENLALGSYIIEVEGTDALCGASTETIFIDQPSPLTVATESEHDLCISGEGWIEIQPDAEWSYSYELYDSNNELFIAETDVYGNSYIESLNGDVYTINTLTACGVLTEVVDLTDPNGVSAGIDATQELVLEEGTASVDISSTSENADSFQWLIDGEAVSSLESFTHAFDQIGTYEITLIASNEFCEATSTIEIQVTEVVNIDEEMIASLNAYVVVDGIRVDMSAVGGGVLNVFNAAGQLVFDEQVTNTTLFTIPTQNWSKGVYTITVNAANKLHTTQVIR